MIRSFIYCTTAAAALFRSPDNRWRSASFFQQAALNSYACIPVKQNGAGNLIKPVKLLGPIQSGHLVVFFSTDGGHVFTLHLEGGTRQSLYINFVNAT